MRADIFMSNLPVDLDITLYGQKSVPLRGEPTESIAYLDDVTLDLNPFDDVIQADTVQDIPQVLPDTIADPDAFAVSAISSNRGAQPRADPYRHAAGRAPTSSRSPATTAPAADTPYALRLRIDGTVAREPCAALPYPGVDVSPTSRRAPSRRRRRRSRLISTPCSWSIPSCSSSPMAPDARADHPRPSSPTPLGRRRCRRAQSCRSTPTQRFGLRTRPGQPTRATPNGRTTSFGRSAM